MHANAPWLNAYNNVICFVLGLQISDCDVNVYVVTRWRQRIIVSRGGSTFRLLNVTESDAGVLQCNASNEHGYVFANVHLSVQG